MSNVLVIFCFQGFFREEKATGKRKEIQIKHMFVSFSYKVGRDLWITLRRIATFKFSVLRTLALFALPIDRSMVHTYTRAVPLQRQTSG